MHFHNFVNINFTAWRSWVWIPWGAACCPCVCVGLWWFQVRSWRRPLHFHVCDHSSQSAVSFNEAVCLGCLRANGQNDEESFKPGVYSAFNILCLWADFKMIKRWERTGSKRRINHRTAGGITKGFSCYGFSMFVIVNDWRHFLVRTSPIVQNALLVDF